MKFWGESILGLLGILVLVVAISGCTSSNVFENNVASFDIPVNWTVDDETINNTYLYVKLTPSEELIKSNPSEGFLEIEITELQSNSIPSEWMDGIEQEGFADSPKFQVLKRENVTVDGQPGDWLVYNDVNPEDLTFSGPVYTISDILFQKNGKTYRINVWVPKGSYTDTDEAAALNVIISTIKIK